MRKTFFPYNTAMKKLAFLTLIALIIPIVSPIGGSFHLAKKYTYASEEQFNTLHFTDIQEPTASTNELKSVAIWKRSTGTATFSAGQSMFTVKIPKTFVIEAGDNPVRINLTINEKIFPLSIDLDGDGRDEEFYYTEPLFLDKTDRVSYTIETK